MLRNLSELQKAVFYCLKLAWQSSKGYTVLRLAGNFLIPVFTIIASYITKLILDLLTAGSSGIERQILFLLLSALLVSLVINFLRRFTQYTQTIHNSIIQNHINLSLLDDAISADLSLFDNAQFYDKFTAVQRDSYSLSSVLWSVLDCISAIFSLASTFVILAQQNIWYAIIITVLVIPQAIANPYYTRKIYYNDLEQIINERKKNYILSVCTSKYYAQEIRCWNLGRRLKAKYQFLWEVVLRARKKLSFQQTISVFWLSLLPEAAVCVISFLIALRVINGSLSIGDYSFYTGMMAQILSSMTVFATHMVTVYDNKLKVENMNAFTSKFNRTIISGAKPIQQIEQIEFRDVCFQYPGTSALILDHVSFTIKNKETVVLVGKNGSGKSTLIKLLLRLYDVTSGTILVNGEDIRSYRLEDLHRCFGIYFQNAPNFSFTIRENIVLNEDDDKNAASRIRDFLLACAGEDIVQACHGDMDTYLTRIFSDKGIELSEGQHQKVAIVRALYHDASCLILDEPSSALDPEAEHRIFESLHQVAKDKLTLLTSHRFSNIDLADRIILLENGRILEDGTRDELLAQKGSRFAELYEYQAQKFRNTPEQ